MFNHQQSISLLTADTLVRDAIPVPATLWLFGSAPGLIGWKERRSGFTAVSP